MRLLHPDHPGAVVRLGYCLNVHAAETVAGVLEGVRAITVPVARALGGDAPFGVGPWLAAAVAHDLAANARALEPLESLLAGERLVPFTFNAFPFGGFHTAGLKAGVFRPTWLEAERAEFTRAVAGVAARLAMTSHAVGEPAPLHVSISTHCGGFGTDVQNEEAHERVAQAFAAIVERLVALEAQSGVRIVLSLEPEPRSSANDTGALPALFERVRRHAQEAHARRHLGACLDACHAAVEFEDAEAALLAATADGHPLGKLQFSSALRAPQPGRGDALERLFALDEAVYLHQVTGRNPAGLVRSSDLNEARAAWTSGDPAWRSCDELRCHFHVPVDLDRVGGGLGTTRAFADDLLDLTLEHPERWPGTTAGRELHVEVETYTWDVLPPEARGEGGLVGGIQRELAHVLQRLQAKGWLAAGS